MIYKQIKLNISLWGTWTGKTHLSRLWISPLYRCIRYNILWVGVTIFISVLIRMTPVHPLIITLSWWPSKNKTAQNWKNKSTGFFFSFLKVVIYISNDNFKIVLISLKKSYLKSSLIFFIYQKSIKCLKKNVGGFKHIPFIYINHTKEFFSFRVNNSDFLFFLFNFNEWAHLT